MEILWILLQENTSAGKIASLCIIFLKFFIFAKYKFMINLLSYDYRTY